jgi:hypothetical protein
MATYGVSASEFGPSRPPRLPSPARTVDPRPVAAPPAAAGVVHRAAVLLLVATTVVALRTVVTFEMLPH